MESCSAHELPRDGRALAQSVAACIEAVVSQAPHALSVRTTIGIAAPGPKTDDGRGIAHARYLEPQPTLLEDLESALHLRGLDSIGLPQRLVSDAQAALFGETVVLGGLLTGPRDTLFVGPGSGLAEALLVNGSLQTVGGPRASELPPTLTDGACSDLEEEVSLGGVVRRWNDHQGGRTQLETIEAAAVRGDETATCHLERFAAGLERVIEVRSSLLEELRGPDDSVSPALLVRTRRGKFFANPAVQAIVVPRLREAAQRCGATLVVPEQPASPHAACAGALALTLRDSSP